jgi:WD40 repeat protein
MGTPSYMAPEQAMARKEEIGVATDVYGLGAVFYELLTGRPPFRGPNEFATLQQVILLDPPPPHRWQPGIPRDLETICLKCLEKAPARRYASAQALAEDLRRFQEGKPILARPVGRLERALKWARRRPAVAGLLAGLILATLFGFAGIMRGWQLAEEHGRAEASARHDAEAARRDAIDKLWASLVAQTRAGRWSGQVGRRFAGLDALAEAAQLDLPAGRSVLELRNEAAACLALIDLRPGRAYEVPSPLGGVAFDETFTHYATSTLDGTLLVRDAGTDEEVGRLPNIGAGYAYRLGFSPDGRYLAAQYLSKRLAVWEWRSGKDLFQTWIGSHFAFSPESGRLAFDSSTHGPSVIDLATGQATQRLPLPPARYALAWHPDGRLLATGGMKAKGRVVVFEVASGQEQQSWLPPGPAYQLAYAPDGRRLAGACENGLLYVWNAASGAPLHTLEGHQTEVVDVTFDHAGRLLLSAGWDDHFRLWDSQTGEPLLHLPGPGLAQFRRDDQVLAHTRAGNHTKSGSSPTRERFVSCERPPTVMRCPGASTSVRTAVGS